MLTTLLIFIAILAVLVLAHEFGHFIVARKNGVRVEEFGFGFPPRIFGVRVLRGEKTEKAAGGAGKWRFIWGRAVGRPTTEGGDWREEDTIYSLNWIPLGGFVKIKGENGDFAEEKNSFAAKPISRRALILAAGVLMNFILAGFLLAIGFGLGIPQSLDSVGRGAQVKDPKVEIMDVLAGSPADKAGLRAGDEIKKIDELSGPALAGLREYINEKKGERVAVAIRRGAETLEKEIIPVELTETKKGGLGVALIETGIVSYPWYLALYRGFEAAAVFSWEVLKALWFLLVGLFTGAGVTENLSGPVGIAVLTGRVARLGFIYLLQFTAMLSVNLAILNLLPFPALDGGRLLFLAVEKLRGRPVRQRVEQIAHTAGFALLMLLVILVTYRDVVRFGGGFARLGRKFIGGF